ncbi:MAG: PEGA domain-containing protein [Myxococcales bacterium]
MDSQAAALSPQAQRQAWLGRLLVLISGGCAAALGVALAIAALQGPPPRKSGEKPVAQAVAAPTPSEPSVSDPNGIQVTESEAETFLIVVESKPDRAKVLINGADEGLTPLSATPACALGTPLQITVSRAGYAPARYSTTCRTKRLVNLFVPLTKAR